MTSVTLTSILNAVAAAAPAFAGVFPPAALVSVGIGLTSSIIATLHQAKTQVVDANGVPIDLPTLATQVQATFAKAAGIADQGIAVADDQLAKNPPIA